MAKRLPGRLFPILAFSVLTMLPTPASANDIFYANNNLTFQEFLGAFNSNDKRLQRDAIVYLYGVIDATEKNTGAASGVLNQWS